MMDDYIRRKAVLTALKTLLADENDYSDQYHDGYVDGVYDAEDAVKGLPSADVPQWIPCDSGIMPDTNDEVLTTYIVNGNDKKRYVEAATWWEDDSDEGGCWTSFSDEYRKLGTRVERLAWRPMPKPWKGET